MINKSLAHLAPQPNAIVNSTAYPIAYLINKKKNLRFSHGDFTFQSYF